MSRTDVAACIDPVALVMVPWPQSSARSRTASAGSPASCGEGIAVHEHFGGDGAMVYKHACALGREGIVSSVTAVALSVDSNVSRVSAVKTRSGRGLAHPRQTVAMMARRFPPPWTVEERRLASSSATTTGKHSLSCMRGRALGLKSTPDHPRR